jgi:hypothetical protein
MRRADAIRLDFGFPVSRTLVPGIVGHATRRPLRYLIACAGIVVAATLGLETY